MRIDYLLIDEEKDVKDPSLLKIEFEDLKEIKREEVACDICFDVFVNQETLQEHYKGHEHTPVFGSEELQRDDEKHKDLIKPTEKKVYYCHHHNTCTKLFTQNELLKHCKHHDIKIENSTAYFLKALHKTVKTRATIEESCEICFKLFPTKLALSLHYEVHDNVYKCVECNAGFKQIIEYITHTKTHREDNMYQCPSCDIKSEERRRISSHILCHELYRRYKCQICEKRFPTYQPYNEHVKIYHKGEPPLSCEICGKDFNSSRTLISHRRKKHRECHLCGKKIASFAMMQKHTLSHNSVTRHVCDDCGKVYINKELFDVHIKRHKVENQVSFKKDHVCALAEDKPYKCPECGKGFTRRTNMVIHSRLHTKERPYECSFCDRKFSTNKCKKEHEHTHTGDKPYKCPHCNKHFTQRTTMVRHSRTHTGERPFKCSFCDKKFTTNNYRKDHERTHTGYKPYKCSHCNKSFTQRTTMVRHSRLHTGERPYICLTCNRYFTTKCSLQYHTKVCKGRDSNGN